MPEKDLYKILGIPRTSSPSDIQTAFRRLLRQYHPDVYDGDPKVASANTRELTDAYDILSDPVRRQLYDEQLVLQSTPPPGAPKPWVPPHSTSPTVIRATAVSPGGVAPAHGPAESSGPTRLPLAWQRLPAWQDEERAANRRARRVLLVFIAGVVVLVVTGTLVPVAHAVKFTVSTFDTGFTPDTCQTTQIFPSGAQVQLAWQVHNLTALLPGTVPDVIIWDPSGDVTLDQGGWSGSTSFAVPTGGDYYFGVTDCAIAVVSIQFTGEFTAPFI